MEKGVFEFRVRSYECGADGFATMPTICNYLQEAASLDAERRGFSKSDFDGAGGNVSWVLTRLRVKMERYPKWEDAVAVTTFPRGGRRIVAWRDFALSASDGSPLGLATSEWMMIDLSTRKIAPIPGFVLAAADGGAACVLGDAPFTAKLRFPAPESGAARFGGEYKAMASHVDLNGHVNNVRYVEWLLEPTGNLRPAELEIAFRSETFAGETVRVETAPGADAAETLHRVFSPAGADHAVARTR